MAAYIRITKGKIRYPEAISVPDKKRLEKYIRKAYSINRRFWGIDQLIRIRLAYSRKDFDKEWGSHTEKWVGAIGNNFRIFIFAPLVYKRLSTNRSSYLQLLTHEMCHVFYTNFVGTWKPLWLHEGLAMWIAKQGWFHGSVDTRYLIYAATEHEKWFRGKTSKLFYRSCFLFTKLLIKTKTKRAVMTFLKQYKMHANRKAYDILYKKLMASLNQRL